MTNKIQYLIPLACVSILTWSVRSLAHGSNIQYRSTEAIEIQAVYDDGTPMANAQVVVYPPEDPSTPWLKGITNSEGKFVFVPQSEASGNWDIKVRQSGHGDIVSIPWNQENLTTDTTPESNRANRFSTAAAGYTPVQKIVMAAVGIWGFVGTALFFSRSKISSN